MESVMVDRDGKITMANDNREERSRWETTDVQALGGLFYGMLTGKPPGRLAAGEESAASLSPRLRTILERSLSRDPRNRYATVEDFFRDVEREERVQFYQTLLIPLVLVGLLTLLYLLQNNH
jgi:serine/threonine protein kinase